MNRRSSDPDNTYYERAFTNDRFFATAEGWFYESRLVKPYGPFKSRELAEENCRLRFSGELGTNWNFD